MRSFLTLSIVICVALGAVAAACVRADNAPPTAPPLVGATPAPAATAASAPALAGVTIGDDPAKVLSRLGLHPPGWVARSPDSVGEMRMFPIDDKRASMMLLFDKTIEMVGVRTNTSGANAADSYGVKLGATLTELITLRGAPVDIRDGTKYLFEGSDSIRWEYDLKDGKVDAITVSDCRIANFCGPPRTGN